MRIIGVIPARFASSRFPGKPLHRIAGKPLVQHVIERCQLSNSLTEVVVATDDQRIADAAAHYVLVAFNRGVAEAAQPGTGARWVVDDGGAPCPDCDDNALAGSVPAGEPFPTGDLHPPAHPGCRCLAVPA